jgi:23S rRNA (uracil1939-C5)-methyltransferase
MKAQILEETLTRAHLSPLPDITTHAGKPFGYRNRIRLHIDPFTSTLGYRERGSHRLLRVDVCPIAAPELEQALQALAPVFAARHAGKLFSQVELSINHDGSELLLALWLRSTANHAQAELDSLCKSVSPLIPVLRGAAIQAAPSARTTRDKRPREESDSTLLEDAPGSLLASWGEPRMAYRVGGSAYRVSLGAFFQVNRSLVPKLVELATSGRSGAIAWDLYAGVGLFSTVLAQQFTQVIAVEGAPVSSEDLRANLGGTSAHQAVRSSTLDFLRRQRQKKASRPDFVLVDPPRAGLGSEATELLAQIRPAHITYVSCDPATLARDLRALVESGYQLQQLHLIDLFPQTFHLETVAMLSLT